MRPRIWKDALNSVRERTIAEMEQRANTIEGPGIPSVVRTQRLNAIFDDLIATLQSGSVGLGLGLYIVQQIVEAHNGTISVESSPALNTTFTLCLSRHPASAPA